jgi:uncharacterized protein
MILASTTPIPCGRAFKGLSVALLALSITLAASSTRKGIDPALSAKAKAGDATAEFNLGLDYANGIGVPRDDAKAARWLLKAAEQGFVDAREKLVDTAAQGNVDAQVALGHLYSHGPGLPQNYAHAAAWYLKAAEQGSAVARKGLVDTATQGNVDAQVALGYLYSHGPGLPQNYAQATVWYLKAAEQGSAVAREGLVDTATQGNVDAQVALGHLYSHGPGVPQNYAQAAAWYLKAAEQGSAVARKELVDTATEGNADAQVALGHLHSQGPGMPQNYAQAARWYLKAAEQGSADAQEELGDMYRNGTGVAQNYSQAAAWYLKAAEQGSVAGQEGLIETATRGNVEAQVALGHLYSQGSGIPQNYAQAAAWYLKAAKQGSVVAQEELIEAATQGNVDAQAALGRLYSQGPGVPLDFGQAAAWYRKAADQDSAIAQKELGDMYRSGTGVPQNYAQARILYGRAAQQGNGQSAFSLACMSHLGQGVPQDDSEIVAWWQNSAEKGNADAQANLAFFYLRREGVLEDYAEAYFWLDLAASGKLESFRQEDVIKARDDAASNLTSGVLLDIQKSVTKWSEDHATKR